MSRLKLVALIALVGGPAFGYITHQETVRLQALEKEGETVPGVITGGELSTGRRGSKKFDFEVIYKTKKGDEVKKTFRVYRAFAEKYVADKSLIRDDVEVRYLPKDPQNAILVGSSNHTPEMEYVGYGVGAVGLLGTVALFRRKESEAPDAA